jgi:hypothetical protein
MEPVTEQGEQIEQVEQVKRGRGRPKKEKVISDEPVEKKKRGRPKKIVDVVEIKEKQKPGPKGDASYQPGYFTQFYKEKYQGVYVCCPVCNNPNVSVVKIHRHVKTRKCMLDDLCKKYKSENIVDI